MWRLTSNGSRLVCWIWSSASGPASPVPRRPAPVHGVQIGFRGQPGGHLSLGTPDQVDAIAEKLAERPSFDCAQEELHATSQVNASVSNAPRLSDYVSHAVGGFGPLDEGQQSRLA